MSARILVAEDEIGIRTALSLLLEEEGYQVTTASDGREAIEVVRGRDIDLVVSDIRMPGMSGLQFLEEVRKLPYGPEIILITAYGSVETAIQAMKKGARDFLLKPFSNDMMKMTVRRVLELRELSEENKRLHDLETIKNEFIAMVAHELRTPLTAIKGYLKLVLSGQGGPLSPQQARYLEVVNHNQLKLQRVVEEVLDIAQLERHELALHSVGTDLLNLLGRTVQSLQESLDTKGLKLEVNLDVSLGPIVTDPHRLKQVLLSLLENAIAFSPQDGRIALAVRPWEGKPARREDTPTSYVDFSDLAEGEYIEFSVRDEGHGIPPERLSEIFRKFQQAQDLYVRQVGGIGLGLALCQRILEAMGGKIWVKSRLGEGCAFHFIIPWRSSERPAATPDTDAGGR